MICTGEYYSSYPALPGRRIEGAAVRLLRICPRLQVLSRFARLLKGKPPAQTEGKPILASFNEGVLNGLNFWGRTSGFVGVRQIQMRGAGWSFFGRPVQWLEA